MGLATRTYPLNVINAIAVMSCTDPRSVGRVLSGEQITGGAMARIERVFAACEWAYGMDPSILNGAVNRMMDRARESVGL